MLPVTYDDIIFARRFISPYLARTPLVRLNKISDELGCEYYAKLENLQPIGAFKVRGGVNLVGTATEDERRNGIVTASTGNHGQSIAFGGRLFNTHVIVYAPAENVNQAKVQAMRDLGAEVRFHGKDFDEARLECERISREEGMLYVHSANEPKLIAGVGTIALEILEDLADVEVVVVPAGGGSCAAGHCIVMKHVNPKIRVIAVQSDGAPAMWHAWRNRNLDPYPTMKTEHEGLASRVPFQMTNKILWELLDEFVLVTDDEINEAIRLLARNAKQVAEGAGAASLAGAIKLKDQLRGKKVVGILTGGNLPPERLARVLASANR